MSDILGEAGLDLLFRNARTFNGWQDRAIEPALLHKLYDTLKWGPTSFNCQPARFVFVQSPEAKARLKPHLIASNAEKTMKAPVCVIVAYDPQFFDHLPEMYPAVDAKPFYSGNTALADATAKRNGTLQGGYLIMAARALGLDCGPMSGFNPEGVDKEFFPDGKWKSNFLCAIGYGAEGSPYPRGPRFEFDRVCTII